MRANLDDVAEALEIQGQQLAHDVLDGYVVGYCLRGELHGPNDWVDTHSLSDYLKRRLDEGEITRRDYKRMSTNLKQFEDKHSENII